MKKNITYRLVKMNLKEFAILDDCIQLQHGDDIAARQCYGFAYSFEKGNVRCTLSTTYSFENRPLMKAKLDCIFNLDKATAEMFRNSGEAELDVAILQQIASLSYGTMRGVLFAKSMNTNLSGLYLPLIDISKVITTPMVFQSQE